MIKKINGEWHDGKDIYNYKFKDGVILGLLDSCEKYRNDNKLKEKIELAVAAYSIGSKCELDEDLVDDNIIKLFEYDKIDFISLLDTEVPHDQKYIENRYDFFILNSDLEKIEKKKNVSKNEWITGRELIDMIDDGEVSVGDKFIVEPMFSSIFSSAPSDGFYDGVNIFENKNTILSPKEILSCNFRLKYNKEDWFDGLGLYRRLKDKEILIGDYLVCNYNGNHINILISLDYAVINSDANKHMTFSEVMNANTKFRLKTKEELSFTKYTFYYAMTKCIGLLGKKIKYMGTDDLCNECLGRPNTVQDIITFLGDKIGSNTKRRDLLKEKAWVIVDD